MTAEEILRGLMEVVDFDQVAYDIKEHEGRGWDGPEITRFSELLREAETPTPPAFQQHLITCLREVTHEHIIKTKGLGKPFCVLRAETLLRCLSPDSLGPYPTQRELAEVVMFISDQVTGMFPTATTTSPEDTQ